MYNYLINYDILFKELFAFREGLSTDTATYVLLNSVLISFDKKHFVGGVFYGLQKAFDCVNHNIVLAKLEFYGFSRTANLLMRSYLENRFQRMVIKDNMHSITTSAWVKMEHGVPQGSVLGPLLFLIYINDLAQILRDTARPVVFADVTSIVISNADMQEFKDTLKSVMDIAINWFQNNLLSMNYGKTQFYNLQPSSILNIMFK